MKNIHQVLALICLLAFGFNSNAQKLLIKYDYLKDDYSYFKVKKSGEVEVINRPNIGLDKDVKIEVINFNPFIYAAKATFQTSKVEVQNNFSLLTMLSPISGMSPTSFLSKLDEEVGSRGGPVMGAMKEKYVKDSYTNLVKSYNNLYTAESEVNKLQYAITKLKELKYNRFLPSDSIKAYSQSLISEVLDNSTTYSSVNFYQKAESIQSMVRNGVSEVNSNANNFVNNVKQFSNFSESGIHARDANLLIEVESMHKSAEAFSAAFAESSVSNQYKELESLYQSIIGTEFQFNALKKSSDDEMDISIDFYEIPQAAEIGQRINIVDLDESSLVKSTELNVTVKGDLKIISSIGISFPAYSDNFEYINKDSLITQVDGDKFSPNISAHMLFFPYRGKSVNLGGSFGVGIPIASNSRDLNFLLGGSAIFGKSNRIALNAGVAIGQVTTLAAGFVNGDNLGSLIEDVPTKKTYDIGYFFGLSFALADIK